MVTARPFRSARQRLVTAADLLQMPQDDARGELIRGELCEMPPPGSLHAEVVARVIALLYAFVNAQQLGRVFGDGGVIIDRDPDTVRAPDAAFFTSERLPLSAAVSGYFSVVPNLIIEVESPHDGRWALHDKALMWLSHGAEIVWVIRPEERCVDIYLPDRSRDRVTEPTQLEGLDVLPGFSCSLEEIFGPAPQADAPVAR